MTTGRLEAPILRIENLSVEAIGARAALLVDAISLTLAKEEVLGLIGESGAGKTTLGLAALGHARPGCVFTAGQVVFEGVDILALPPAERRKLLGRRIAYVAQSAAAAFNPRQRIIDQVIEAPVHHGLLDKAAARKRAVALFDELSLPDPSNFGERYPHQVSGGQLQRAMAAMAMSCRPEILILDEPTTALDVTTQIEVLAAIRNLIRRHGAAGLYISHDLAIVAQVTDRIMVMRRGRLVEQGATREIIDRPQEDYTRKLIGVHGDHAGQSPSRTKASGEPILRLDGVSAAYTDVRAVKDASFDLARGETLALVGESGSGKSTLGRVICGLKASSAGGIMFAGSRLDGSFTKRSKDQLRRIQLVYQTPSVALNPRQTIFQIIGRPLKFYFNLGRRALEQRVAELIQHMELPDSVADALPSALSGGQMQRVAIARALAAEPDLIVCDEVTSALDPLVAEEILGLLKRLQEETGVSYLFITHDLAKVRRIAHRVAVMRYGEILDIGSKDEFFRPPHHPYTELLLSSVPEMRVGWLDELLATASGQARREASRSS